MLGFAFCNPSIAVTLQDYKQYVSEVIKSDADPELEAVGKFLKRTANDPRRKVLWVDGVTTLRRIQADWPAEKMADVLIGVFDVGENLSKVENVQIMDAELEMKNESDKAHQTWKMHKYDLTLAMKDAQPGFQPPKRKFVQPDAPTKMIPVVMKRPNWLPPDSLSKIFDPMLATVPEKKRPKLAGFVAARLEGILTKEEWTKSLELLEKYGVAAVLIKGAIRLYRDAGHLKPLRSAVRSVVVDGVDLDTAVQVAGARHFDVDWVNRNWGFENISAEMFAPEA